MNDFPNIRVFVFRALAAYFGLFCLTSQIPGFALPIPGLDSPELETLPPLRQLVDWTASNLLKVDGEIGAIATGSGDRIFDWAWLLCRLILSLAGAGLWTWISPVRGALPRNLWRWFSLMLRVAVGSEMLAYGFEKVFPLQMPFPPLIRLVQPLGNSSLMGMLWSSIGASPAYERILGSVEVLGGVLILIPRTALAGALVCAGVSLQIFLLNMTYDVPVKILSFHLLAMSLLAAAPELRPLAAAVFAPRDTFAWSTRGAWLQWIAAAALFASYFHYSYSGWFEFGPSASKSPVYGIWNVETMVQDGRELTPLLTDPDRFRRVIFDDFAERMAFQRMDDSLLVCTASIDSAASAVTLMGGRDEKCDGRLLYRRASRDSLLLEGSVNRHPIQIALRLQDREKFRLLQSRFRWVQEAPFNR